MRYILVLAFLFLTHQFCFSQNLRRWDAQIDSLQNQLENASNDSVKIATALGLIDFFIGKGWTTTNLGQFAIAYQTYGRAFELWEAPEMEKLFTQNGKKPDVEKSYWSNLANLNFNYGHLMKVTGNSEEQQFYYQKAYQIASKWDDVKNTVYALSGMAYIHLKNNELDSALINMVKSNSIPPELYNYDGYSDMIYIDGTIKLKSEQFEEAKNAFLKGAHDAFRQSYVVGRATNNLGLSMVYRQLNIPDSSLYYGKTSLGILRRIREIQLFDIDIATAYENLYQHFLRFDQPDSAFIYLELAHQERAILTDQKIANLAAFQQVLLERERRVNILEKEKIEIQSRNRTYAMLTGLVVFVLIGLILYRSNRQKQKANMLLAKQKDEIQSTLTKLKATQAQLIQSEKMASLGELTAGIAHEIQNPLNFVNNFSEVSKELLIEMKEELANGSKEEAEAIADDLIQNLDKINHHGKRAASIVKGMLQHSRSSSGHKELTDLNVLADEYLRLSYHGLRAKDKTFQADFKMDLDPHLPRINVNSQDIGRVLLNLINNAFYAVSSKALSTKESGYKPEVIVTTGKHSNAVAVSIRDNGDGIPANIKGKIFQPFFTTKPPGEGTGLGLSLSFEIIKAHGGEILLDTNEALGTTITVSLPINEM